MSDTTPSLLALLSLDHVGIATNDLDATLRLFRNVLGLEVRHVEELPGPGLRAAIGILGGQCIELLAPTRDETPVSRFLERRGPGIHHLAYQVKDIEASTSLLIEAGLEPLSATPEPGIGGARTIFFHPRTTYGVLLELVEPAPSDEMLT